MLVGWNSKGFDIPYIMQRMEVHGVHSSYIRNILHEDLMTRVQYFYSKDPEARQKLKSYSLNSISKYFLNEEKIERAGKVYDLMVDDFETFKAYNIQDCQLVRKLEDKLGLIEQTYRMFQICQCTAQNWSPVKAIDNFLLSEGNKQKIHFPTNESFISRDDDEEIPYLGAFVLDPTPGFYSEVYDLDFKSLYPNIIRTFNISPDSRIGKINSIPLIETPGMEIEGVVRGKCYFDDTIQGIIPKKIKILLDERAEIRTKQKEFKKDSQEWRDLNVKQLVVKELANSIYGVIGNKYFRSFDIELAESITATGQYLIKYLKRTFEEKGRKVIYGDTDSVFVILKDKEKVEQVIKDTNEEIKHHLMKEFHVKDCSIELDLDKTFDKFLILSKKKYVGYADNKFKYVGMECVKRDSAQIANDYQIKILDEIFKGIPEEEMIILIQSMKKSVIEDTLPLEKIVVSKKLGKDANLYTGKGLIHVRVAKTLKKDSKEKEDLTKGGSIITFVYTNGNEEGIHISEYAGSYDKIHYWNHIIYPLLERVLDVAFPDVKWVDYYQEIIKPKKHDRTKTRRSDDSSEE